MPNGTKTQAFAISQYFDVETGETCRLSDITIAAKTGLPVRCVLRARIILRDRGWLSWRRTKDGSFYCPEPGAARPAARKAQRRRAPQDTPPAAQTKPSTIPQDTPPAADQDTPPAAQTSLLSPLEKNIGRKKDSPPSQLDLLANGQPGEQPIQPEPVSRRSSKKESTPPQTRFDEFWSVYPRKDDRKAAEAAYARAVRNGTTEEELVAGAMRFSAERAGEDPAFTKYGVTWLKGECWKNPSAPKPPVNGFNGGSRAGPRPSYNESILAGLAKVAGVAQ
jgi:hypothetical protein